MTQSLILLVSTILVSIADPGFEYEVLSNWEVKRVSEDIEFSYRDVRVGDTLETKEMRMRFQIEASAAGIIPYFKDPELFMAWSPDVDECELVNGSGSEWTLYKFYDMPWPIAERDIVTKCELMTSDTLTHLRITGVKGGVPERDGVKRITSYEGQWFMRPESEGSSRIEFRTVQLGAAVGPRALQNKVVENSFVKSVKLLKQLAQK